MQIKNKIFFKILIISSLSCFYGLELCAQATLNDADSLFRYRQYPESYEKYAKIWEKDQTYSPSMLLKMAFVKKEAEEYAEELFFLNQYYIRDPDSRVWQRIGEVADKYKLQGYQNNDLEYLVILYRKHQLLFTIVFLLVFLAGMANLVWRWWNGNDILYRVIVFNILVMAYVWLFNYGLSYQKGIVKNDRVLLMNAPSAGARLITTTEKGNCMEILAQEDIWYKVRFSHREEWVEGYVRQNNLYLID